jgi:hypothetical protein
VLEDGVLERLLLLLEADALVERHERAYLVEERQRMSSARRASAACPAGSLPIVTAASLALSFRSSPAKKSPSELPPRRRGCVGSLLLFLTPLAIRMVVDHDMTLGPQLGANQSSRRATVRAQHLPGPRGLHLLLSLEGKPVEIVRRLLEPLPEVRESPRLPLKEHAARPAVVEQFLEPAGQRLAVRPAKLGLDPARLVVREHEAKIRRRRTARKTLS